jgi:hypothetical protein
MEFISAAVGPSRANRANSEVIFSSIAAMEEPGTTVTFRVIDGSVLKRDLIDAGGLRELVGYDFVEVVRTVVVGPDRFPEVERDRITAGRGGADKGEVNALVIEAAGEFDKFWSGELRGGDDGSDTEVGGG